LQSGFYHGVEACIRRVESALARLNVPLSASDRLRVSAGDGLAVGWRGAGGTKGSAGGENLQEALRRSNLLLRDSVNQFMQRFARHTLFSLKRTSFFQGFGAVGGAPGAQ
jgi:hypothetical protein